MEIGADMKKRWIVDVIAIIITVAVFLLGSYFNYYSYYFQTKPAVRYNDFIILAYTLPQVIPKYIENADSERLDEVVKLSKHNFGIVIDVPSLGKKWSSNSETTQDYLNDVRDKISGKVFAIPIFSEPYACTDWENRCLKSIPMNSPRRIATLYFIHQDAKSFLSSLQYWVYNPSKVIANIFIASSSIFLFLIYLFARSRYLTWQSQKNVMIKALSLLERQMGINSKTKVDLDE